MRAPPIWIVPCALLAGCATLPDGRLWGDTATISPGWERVSSAASQAARDPWVWAPLASAAVLQINSWDREVSDWAIRETPVFGSQQNAGDWSDHLHSTAIFADFTTIILAPSGDDAHTWFKNKAKGYAVEFAATSAAQLTTHVLKSTTGRTRPSGSNDESFPSGHATTSATYSRLAARNLDYLDLMPATRRGLTYGLDAITVATAWSRVEAGDHYPADTLFSIALGNFMANFFKNAFMESGSSPKEDAAVVPTDGGLMLQFSARF
ncbi:MAG: phosphatase PAP2 family protein [Burkholderiales bacterium]